MDSQLDDENEVLKNVIQQTIVDTKKKIGIRTNAQPINYFNEINFGNAFTQLVVDGKKKDNNSKTLTTENFKKYMSDSQVDIGSLMLEDSSRRVLFNNYRIINKHIPECAQALNIYKDNIMSPDDFTKLIFNVNYETSSTQLKDLVEEKLDNLIIKYNMENIADEIIGEALLYGESYYAVLSLENELNALINNNSLFSSVTSLNQLNEEQVQLLDKNITVTTVLSENIQFNEESLTAFNEFISNETAQQTNLEEKTAKEIVSKLINENIKIGSSKELLLEKFEADSELKSKTEEDIPTGFYNKKKNNVGRPKKQQDKDPLYINGSVVRHLDPDRIVELSVDGVCYGYYYAEQVVNNVPLTSYLGTTGGRNVSGTMQLGQNNTIMGSTMGSYNPSNPAAAQLGVGEQKLKLITNLFVDGLARKVDKDFIRKNKQFKDFIYDLLRQDYIVKKGLKLTYFMPQEVVKFEAVPVYRDITFFAKLYLSILTNNLLIKLGRAHDKRIFYVNTGVDANYESAIQSVIADVKTKDYKMEQLNDFNTVLNLTPGRFDDYYMPTVNGERPIEIETLPGMDVDMDNEFVQYLKNSMMSGMGVPTNLIDVTSEVDYARSISAMNANFVRSVIRYQKRFQISFTRMLQILFKNEYKYINDAENEDMRNIDISAIKVTFPSPATLAMTNISDQIQAAEQNADFISQQIIPVKQDGSTEDQRQLLKTRIIKDLVPSIDWDKYEGMVDEIKRQVEKEKIDTKGQPDPNDPNAMGGMGAQYY